MKDDRDPVSLDEYVLRRIHKSAYDASLPVPIVRTAFQPTRYDTDGISLYREVFVTAEDVARSGRKAGDYYVARLSVRTLRESLGLRVVADPQETDLPGHCVIPDLCTETSKARFCEEIQRELAILASKAIVQGPDV